MCHVSPYITTKKSLYCNDFLQRLKKVVAKNTCCLPYRVSLSSSSFALATHSLWFALVTAALDHSLPHQLATHSLWIWPLLLLFLVCSCSLFVVFVFASGFCFPFSPLWVFVFPFPFSGFTA
ncbi:hypothetical protein RIF29_12107 [Crotalaria pallida]|uniref:Uncharacterized protein n=1 Tax=Crotalaria pallida TaxID=3830 RepID=A0AAN9IMX2_CROPI